MYKFEFIESGHGNISIDDFSESFDSDHSYWTKEQYEEHWASSIMRVKDGKPSMFIISMGNPTKSNFINTWICYPIEKQLIFQEHIIMLDELNNQFNLDNPHASIPDYENSSEDSEEISEWVTSE